MKSPTLPTAEQSLKSHANTEFMWGYHDVIRAIESHTQAHTKALREELDNNQEALSSERILNEALRNALKALEDRYNGNYVELSERVKELEVAISKISTITVDDIAFKIAKEALKTGGKQ